MSPRARVWMAVLLLAGCAASGTSERPPTVAPAPSPAAIANLGFDGAVKAGSDYVVANTGVDHATLNRSQEIPGGMLALTYDLGPDMPEPVQVVVDPQLGKVRSLEPVQQIPGVTTPAKSR